MLRDSNSNKQNSSTKHGNKHNKKKNNDMEKIKISLIYYKKKQGFGGYYSS